MKNNAREGRGLLSSSVILAIGFTQALANASTSPSPMCEVEPGPVAIVFNSAPARYSFEQADGKAALASESAGDAVASLLDTPNLGHPQLEAAVGVIEFVVSPFVAGYGAIAGGRAKLTPDQLSQREQALSQAMNKMASQDEFRRLVMAQAAATTHRALCEVDSARALPLSRFSAVLEVRVEDLRLCRARNTDKSFRLEIQAHARLVRSVDGSVVYDQPFRYQSGEGLFVDWARGDGFETVARTGYQTLAQQISAEVFSIPPSPPILLGDGQKRHNNHPVARTSHLRQTDWRVAAQSDLRAPGVQFVDYHPPGATTIEILPDISSREFHIQGLVGGQESPLETQTDTEYAVDGLENHRNFVVQVAGCLGAIPMGLWEHTVGAMRQGSDEAFTQAYNIMRQVATGQSPQERLSLEVARCLSGETSDKVLYNQPHSLGDVVLISEALAESGVGLVNGKSRPSTRLEIRVVNCALAGKPAKNPRLQFAFDTEATLVRTSDGQELCTWPVCYRSSPLRLTEWAARDCSALRQEYTRCCQAVSEHLANALILDGFVPPAGPPASTVAAN